jgi:hypothetical protein
VTRSLEVSPRIAPTDNDRLAAAVQFIRTHDIDGVLAQMLPDLTEAEHTAIAAYCRFAHTALLVFPPDLQALDAMLAANDLTASSTAPSVVVRQRLAARHGLPADQLPVQIVRASVHAADGTPCEIEVFALVNAEAEVAAGERDAEHEAHIALATGPIDEVALTGLRAMLTGRGRLRADGGGYNGHEDSTVLYFARTAWRRPGYQRLELHFAGNHPRTRAAHSAESEGPGERLLRLLTGAWATQALAVTAELGVADRLAAAPGSQVLELAESTGTDPGALARLLRYLIDLDVVQSDGTGFALTEMGALLAAGAERSLHPLARLYGGAFYESFGRLDFALRTGRTAFDHHFGQHHFDYFTAEPDRAALFDLAMAASAAIFGHVGQLIDTAAADTVIDVGGGSGELLARVMTASPHLRGVLFERATTLERARATLDRAGCLTRCELVGGDFFTATVPTGGDIYLLARVLHDWSDEDCRTILRRCADAMPEGSRLYVIERLLPEDDSRSLVPAWDLHMLCNVGGRERTRTHYRTLLRSAGLELTAHDELPLGFAILHAHHTN